MQILPTQRPRALAALALGLMVLAACDSDDNDSERTHIPRNFPPNGARRGRCEELPSTELDVRNGT